MIKAQSKQAVLAELSGMSGQKKSWMCEMTKPAFPTTRTDKRWCQQKKEKKKRKEEQPGNLTKTQLINDLRQTSRMLNEQSFSWNKLICWDCMLFCNAGYQILAKYSLCMLSKEGNEQLRNVLLPSTSVRNPPPFSGSLPRRNDIKKETRENQNTHATNFPPSSPLCPLLIVFSIWNSGHTHVRF